MTDTKTFTKTFPNGFTVQITGNSLATSCKNQAAWIDVKAMVASVRTLAEFAPPAMTVNELTALALQQQRGAWLGLQSMPI